MLLLVVEAIWISAAVPATQSRGVIKVDKTREDREKGVKSAPEGAQYGKVTMAVPSLAPGRSVSQISIQES